MSTRTVGTGGSFSTFAAALADVPATFTEVEIIELLDQDHYDVNGFAVTGKTTSSSNYLVIRAASGASCDGRPRAVRGSGARMRSNNADGTLRISAQHCRVEGIELYNESTSSGSTAIIWNSQSAGNDQRLIGVMLHDTATGSTGYTVSASVANLNLTMQNCIVFGSRRSLDSRTATTACVFNNNTYWRHADQIGVLHAQNQQVRNNYSGASTGTSECFWTAGSAPTGNNNASSDPSADDDYASSLINVAGSAVFMSVTNGSEDFRLVSGTNALVDAGATLGSVTTDMAGTARPQGAAYDIGAIERVVASGETFTAGAASTSYAGQAATYSADRSFAANQASIAFTGQQATYSVTSDPSVTTGPIIDQSGNLRANETGMTVCLYHATTHALVVAITGQTTDADGMCTYSSVSLSSATSYRERFIFDDGTDDLPLVTAS